MTREARGGSLASNIMLFALMIAIVSFTIIGLAALAGVYDLAREQVAALQQAVRTVLSVEIDGRLDSSARLVDRASAVLEDPLSPDLDRTALATQFDSGVEFIDRLVVAESNGVVLSAYPVFDAPRSVSDHPAFSRGPGEEISFYYGGEERKELWATRLVDSPKGRFVVMVRVRTSFLNLLVREFSGDSAGRIVFISGPDDEVLFMGASRAEVDLSSLAYEPGGVSPDVGSLSGLTPDGAVLWGHYSLLSGHPGLEWRLSVLEPRSTVVSSTWRALLPAVLALTLSGMLSVGVATVFARRLVAPLRSLEGHAREAVAGAYVSPIQSERHDEVGRLAEAFNEIVLRLNVLQDLSQLLASSSSLDQVLDGILSAMGHIVGSDEVAILLADESGEELIVARAHGLRAHERRSIPLAENAWLAEALGSAGPIAFAGRREDFDQRAPGLQGVGHVAGLITPLQVGSEPLGLVIVIHDIARFYTQAEMEMIRTFSAQAAVAVHNSRLFEFETASRREAEAMRTVAEALANPLDLQGSFNTVMQIARRLFGVASARIAFLDRRSLGLPEARDAQTERLLLRAWEKAWPEGDGNLAIRVQRGQHSVIDRYLEAVACSDTVLLTVMRAEHPAAVVSLGIDLPDHAFTAHERSLAYSLGKQLALALDSAYHYAQAQLRASNLETVFRISQAVSSSLQIKVVLNRVLDVVQKIFSADTVSLMQYDPASHRITTVMARGVISSDMLHFACASGEDVPGMVFLGGEPIKIDDLSLSETSLSWIASEQGLRSMLAVPLLARGRSIGVLTIYSARRAAYSTEDMGLLHTFASQAALAIDTADMYGREHHVSSVLQTSILPKSLPEYEEIESSSVYLPAGEEADIGGDYYDLFRDPKGHIVMAIGDVCGKGVEAATKTSMIKYSVRALVAAGLGPAAVLSEVNRAVSDTGDTSDIVTLWVGVLDAERRILRYADGGHPPAIVGRAGTTKTECLETTGALLGAVADAEYEQVDVPLAEGDLVLLYTDGVTEARRGRRFFGEARIRRAVAAGGSASEVVDRLLGALDHFVPGSLRDDAAVLAVRLRSAEEREASKSPVQ